MFIVVWYLLQSKIGIKFELGYEAGRACLWKCCLVPKW